MADVKLLESQRLADTEDGGGQMTANEVVDGQVNNLFPDISRIDRVNGRVNLRKAFAMATTADTAQFLGLHAMISAPPADDRVNGVLFTTDDWVDERDGAQDYIESYTIEGPVARFYVYDTQAAGQRLVRLLARPDVPLPEIGEVYVLDDTDTGNKQYVRVTSIDHEVQTFTDDQGDYLLRIITLGISLPLQHTFPGGDPTRFASTVPSTTRFRQTTVADAARYFATAPLAEDVSASALSVRLSSIFTQLVPSTNAESAVTDATPAQVQVLTEAAETAFSETFTSTFDSADGNGTFVFRLSKPPAPGTLIITRGGNTWEDQDGSGTLTMTAGVGSVVVTADYQSGAVTFEVFSGLNNTVQSATYQYVPVVAVSRDSHSYSLPVTLGNRGFVYVATIRPQPDPGSLRLYFRALGKWYELVDNGAGLLEGDTNVGAGTVIYATGLVTVTLGALPDIGSSVILNWGAVTEYQIDASNAEFEAPAVEVSLSAGNCEPGTLSISWTSGGAKSATDDGAGNIIGDASGRIIYGTGSLYFRPSTLPDASAVYSISYDAAAVEQEQFNPSKSGATISVTLAQAPVRAGSILLQYSLANANGLAYTVQLVDNGVGQLIDSAGNAVASSVVNYTTGLVTFDPDRNLLQNVVSYDAITQRLPGRTADPTTGYFLSLARETQWAVGCSAVAGVFEFPNGTAVTAWYKPDAASDAAELDEVAAPAAVLDLTPDTTSTIVPGSVLFTWGGKSYFDIQGDVFSDIDHKTGASINSGTIDYESGRVTLTRWNAAGTTTLAVQSLLTQVNTLPIGIVNFRTPGSPVRPGSLQIQANRASDSALVTATADQNGNIDTADMHGYIDVEMGVAAVAFGAYVLDSSLDDEDKAEPWYDVANVDVDGYIWRPAEVLPGTVRYNCVVQTFLPLDPDLLGLDPTRLPLDGRVVAFRPGDTLVVHDTQAETMPSPLSADQVVALPRGSLAQVILLDQAGTKVDPALYTVDLVAGEVTMANPLDLGAYTQPLVAQHRIEDMVLCVDAQITGELSLGQALSHSYTAANSLVSSALVAGDVQARYTNLFSQNTWSSSSPNWTDEIVGSPTTAQYDDVNYPIEVLNANAITQKWALVFKSSTTFDVVGEQLGVIASGSTVADVAPNNPATGAPYFIVRTGGFGAGWATGNAIRFNTVGAGTPIWIARTILPGPAEVLDDEMTVELRWDKD